MNKKYLLVPAIAAFIGLGLLGTGQVLAQTNAGEAPHDVMTKKLVQRFGLKTEDVQKVFTEMHTERQAEMQKKFEEQLNKQVSEKKITEAQKQAILKKHEELKTQRETERESMKNMTPEQRRATAEKRHQELEAWAKEQGIDLQLLHPRPEMGMKMGRGMMRGDK